MSLPAESPAVHKEPRVATAEDGRNPLHDQRLGSSLSDGHQGIGLEIVIAGLTARLGVTRAQE